MKKAYLDNASTTAMHPDVITEMTRVMQDVYGNPSSTHGLGRSAKVVLETARKSIAALINAEAREIIFTSGGTEGINFIIHNAVSELKVKRIITARTEHHAVLNAVAAMAADFNTEVIYVDLLKNGLPDLNHLEALLYEGIPTLVVLMHVNNETGVVLDLEKTGTLCRAHNAYFMTDTVQSVGKTMLDVQQLPVDFIVASAHKFHGPKGVGFIYARKKIALKPLLHGGEQEKGLRGGTEAVHQIAGMATALQLSYANLTSHEEYIKGLKVYLLNQLAAHFPGFKVNGQTDDTEAPFYNIANVLLPLPKEKTAMILFHLDMKGVAVSRGSACQSGSSRPSHVLKEILPEHELALPSLRISLSHYNTIKDIDLLINALKTI